MDRRNKTRSDNKEPDQTICHPHNQIISTVIAELILSNTK